MLTDTFVDNLDLTILDNLEVGSRSIANFDREEVSSFFYPNPATNMIKIVDPSLISNLVIYSTSGKVMFDNYAGDSSISLTDFSSGIYLVKILNSNEGEIIEKLIVNKY